MHRSFLTGLLLQAFYELPGLTKRKQIAVNAIPELFALFEIARGARQIIVKHVILLSLLRPRGGGWRRDLVS
jgi:hypothetical protein